MEAVGKEAAEIRQGRISHDSCNKKNDCVSINQEVFWSSRKTKKGQFVTYSFHNQILIYILI